MSRVGDFATVDPFHGMSAADPAILQKMASIYDNDGDKQQAYQYNFDSYRYFPSNLDVIDWLGSYFIEMQVGNAILCSLSLSSLREKQVVNKPHTDEDLAHRADLYRAKNSKKKEKCAQDELQLLIFLFMSQQLVPTTNYEYLTTVH